MRLPSTFCAGAALLLPLGLAAQSGDEAFFKGDPRTVMLACAEKARSLDPKNEDVLLQTGRSYLLAKERDKAEACFKAAFPAHKPIKTDGAVRMGEIWLESGFSQEALVWFRKVPGINPRAKNDFTEIATHLMDAGLAKEAEEFMNLAFFIDPKDWQNVSAFGRACLRAKRQELAAEWYARAMQTNRKEEGLWNEIALALADQGVDR